MSSGSVWYSGDLCLTGLWQRLQTLWEWDGLDTTGFALSSGRDSRNKAVDVSARRLSTKFVGD